MYELIIIGTALAMLAISSAYDLKWKYVPDYANYSFIIIAGALRIIYAIYENNIELALWAVPGGLILFIFGYSMYKTGMWGGGDTKLVAALGILISWFPGETIPYFIDYLSNILLVGGLYSLPIIIVMILKNRDKVGITAIDKSMIIIALIGCVIVLFTITTPMAILLSIAFITASMTGLLKKVEVLFKKKVPATKLMDGDWLLEEIKVGSRTIKPKKEGLSKEEVSVLKKWCAQGRIKEVLIKDGIAYVPALMISFLVTLAFGNLIILISTWGMPNAELIISLLN